MPSEQDKIGDRINLPLMGVAFAVMGVGFILTILIATMWIGIPLMVVGALWAVGLFYSAKIRSRSGNMM